MLSPTESTHLRSFLIVWVGQLVSTIGNSMTAFAITLWAWELTAQATPLALIGFFSLVPSILMSPFAGALVDRSNRKLLLIVGDTFSILTTGVIVLLYMTDQLQIWHFYVSGALEGIFSQLQGLAYSASLTLMLPKQHYARASGLQYLSSYGSSIIAPAFAGALYYVIGFVGISLLDLLTFVVAIASVLVVPIPQPTPTDSSPQPSKIAQLREDLKFGWRYFGVNPSLWALLMVTSVFIFVHDLGNSMIAPMILARSGNNAQAFGNLCSAAGVGGVTGALLVSTWGGPKRRIQGVLLGMVGAGVSKTVVGFGQTLWVWLPAQVCSSLNFPVKGSCELAIWLAKVPPEMQGRVFAVKQMSLMLTAALARLLAGPLADRVFDPALKPGGRLVFMFGGLLGTGPGAGLALMYILTSLSLVLVGLWGYTWSTLRFVEDKVPNSPIMKTPRFEVDKS